MVTLNVPPSRGDGAASVPSSANMLENGDRLSRGEFERPVRGAPGHQEGRADRRGRRHAVADTLQQPRPGPHAAMITWLGSYAASTPGVQVNHNPTLRLDLDNNPQPGCGAPHRSRAPADRPG